MGQDLEFYGVSFLEHFSQLEDPRIDRKKLYPIFGNMSCNNLWY
jgi:hypothetical protein